MSNEKQQWMLYLLETSWVSVLLDPQHPEANLPDFLRDDTHLVLQYGYNMPKPIPDLHIDEHGIFATLSFGNIHYVTFVPWDAVFAITDGEERIRIWEDNVPKSLDLPPTTSTPPSTKAPAPNDKKRRPPHLKLVD